MSRVMMSMEELENVNGGATFTDVVIDKVVEGAKTAKDTVVEGACKAGNGIADGACWVGGKVKEGTTWFIGKVWGLFH